MNSSTQSRNQPAKRMRRVACIILSFLFLFTISPVSSEENRDSSQVLIIHSYHPSFSWTKGQSSGILNALQSSGLNISISEEYLDWKNFPDPAIINTSVSLLKKKYASRPFDVIVTTDDYALNFVIDHRPDIFGDTPVVFSGVNNYQTMQSDRLANVTGKTEEISPEKTLVSIFMLFPQTSRIYILYEDTETGKGIARRIQTAEEQYKSRAEFFYITNLSFDEIAAKVRELPPDSVILSSFTRDRNGKVKDHDKVMNLLTKEAKAPIFSMYEMAMGYGAIGGSILSGPHEGKITGDLAVRILKGESAKSLPAITEETPVYMFDQDQLDRFTIPLGNIPQGSIILNHQPDMLELYFWEVIAAILVILILICCVFVLVITIRQRKKVEESLRESVHERTLAEERISHQNEFLQQLIDTIPNPVFYKNVEGIYLGVNKAFEDFAGIKRDEIIGKTVYDLWPVHMADIYHARDIELISNPGVQTYEAQGRFHDGTSHHLIFNRATYCDPDGTVSGLLGVVLDISERKEAEKALKRSEERYRTLYHDLNKSQEALSQARKKLDLLNTVTFNEINSAIFSLSAFIQLELEFPMEDNLRTYICRQQDIVRNLQDSLIFAKHYQGLGLKPAAWQNVTQSFLLGISHLRSLNLERDLKIDGLELYADPLLETVFYSLVENVLDYGKTATSIKLWYQNSQDGFTFVFEDDGEGIPEDMKEKVFEREFQQKKGMGLFLCREILAITGIEIRETGTFGHGARFEFGVPEGMYRFDPSGKLTGNGENQ